MKSTACLNAASVAHLPTLLFRSDLTAKPWDTPECGVISYGHNVCLSSLSVKCLFSTVEIRSSSPAALEMGPLIPLTSSETNERIRQVADINSAVSSHETTNMFCAKAIPNSSDPLYAVIIVEIVDALLDDRVNLLSGMRVVSVSALVDLTHKGEILAHGRWQTVSLEQIR
ncbi:uncharacterized protein A1O5_07566 [Cladophialophora psammophila CBS 110553]|uniref:Uncharacterized protein n=1 Tax=Cladophialophora psammophila CBS 110553 TaxID=1182543 RepID=W9WWV0_9EURO|nr:uncharacterized protein A1O5_07566 [Cladophialophora psammophila CBS 110553]EXJ69530.1 hypothetical protein A1O5_07566 [Cladophialophora psammophila CBS 110553]